MVNHEATAAENSSRGAADKLTEPRLWTTGFQLNSSQKTGEANASVVSFYLQSSEYKQLEKIKEECCSKTKELTYFPTQQDSALVKKSFLSLPKFWKAVLASMQLSISV